ncbi:RT0821/Lpp0805 family surface protein [Labrenzia sp. OB1]|uniref:RT0821/Lpp0805 family surface protein n=1 Tax=Labrenzia sp. OB1 TaxID=1561204 RepID=UPI001AD92119|nr:RT0821/Lpp0805 family surface protein [Labrenzia sp. OB1]
MRSYTAGNIKIQLFVAILVIFGQALGGCSMVSMPMGSNNIDSPTLLTGSIGSSSDVAYADINDDDRQIIAENLDAIGPELAAGNTAEDLTLPWLNAVSGNSGTLSKLETASLGDTGCLSFETTANTIAGIKLYSGTACRDVAQKFAVTTLSVSDA